MPYNLGGARIWRIGYDVTCDGAVKREHIGLRNVSSASEQVTFSNHISSLAQSVGSVAETGTRLKYLWRELFKLHQLSHCFLLAAITLLVSPFVIPYRVMSAGLCVACPKGL